LFLVGIALGSFIFSAIDWLSGASFTFNKGGLGAQWELTLDTELFIIIDTLNWSTLSTKASITVDNANISAANVGFRKARADDPGLENPDWSLARSGGARHTTESFFS
jgi:hypothetical protein